MLTYHGCLINFLENNIFDNHKKLNINTQFQNIGLYNYFSCPAQNLPTYQNFLDFIEYENIDQQIKQICIKNTQINKYECIIQKSNEKYFKNWLQLHFNLNVSNFQNIKVKLQKQIIPNFIHQFQNAIQQNAQFFFNYFSSYFKDKLNQKDQLQAQLNFKKNQQNKKYQDLPKQPLIFYMICNSICLLCSVTYHWFYPLSKKAHDLFVCTDFADINVLYAGSAITCIYYGMYCYFQVAQIYLTCIKINKLILQNFLINNYIFLLIFISIKNINQIYQLKKYLLLKYLNINFLFLSNPLSENVNHCISASISVFILSFTEKFQSRNNSTFRVIIYALFSTFMLSPLFHMGVNQIIFNNYNDQYSVVNSLEWYTLGMIFYFIGGFLYSSQFPNCLSETGKYDIIGHSHHYWHLNVVLAIIAIYIGCLENYVTRRDSCCSA